MATLRSQLHFTQFSRQFALPFCFSQNLPRSRGISRRTFAKIANEDQSHPQHKLRPKLKEGVALSEVWSTDCAGIIEKRKGSGIAQVPIVLSLPGERFTYLKTTGKYRVKDVIEASELRKQPDCPLYGFCGGCTFMHVEEQTSIYQQILSAGIQKALSDVDSKEILQPPIPSPSKYSYRTKGAFSVRLFQSPTQEERILVGFRGLCNRKIANLQDQCLAISKHVQKLPSLLSKLVQGLSIKEKIPTIDFNVGESGLSAIIIRTLQPLNPGDESLLLTFAQDYNANSNNSPLQIWLQDSQPQTSQLFYSPCFPHGIYPHYQNFKNI